MPGERLTRRTRLAQQLMAQEAAAPPIQSHMQGLASMFRQGLAGYMQGQDTREEREAQEALMRGLSPRAQAPGVVGPPMAGGIPGSYEQAIEELGGVGGEYGRNLQQQLLMGQLERGLGREEEERKRQTGLETFREEMGIRQEFAPEKERRIIKGADGRNYYADTGEPALPDVKTPQETFMEMMAPAPTPAVSGVPGAGLAGGTDIGLAAGTDVGEPLALEVPPQPQMGIREVFGALPQNIQEAIKMSPDPMKALSGYLLKSKGLEITTNPDGTVSISQGGPAGGWGKKATGTIEEKLFTTREGLARISDIEQSYRPEFQQIGPRISTAWSGIKESMGVDLDPAEQAQLADYSAFKMGAIENINRYIKEITGAQMSEAEAVRLRKGVPDPGDSPWSGDSPTVFDSKLKAQTRNLRSAAARYQYALKNGWDMNPSNLERAMPLNKVEDLIEERGTALERQLRARRPDLSDTAIEGFVMQTLNAEFGVGQ